MGDIMGPQLVSVQEKDGVFETIRLMRTKGVRRIPVVNQDGGLVGIMSADDILDLLAEEMAELAKVAPREQEREAKQDFVNVDKMQGDYRSHAGCRGVMNL